VLLKEPGAELKSEEQIHQWRRFPLGEMVKRGWFGGFHGTLVEAKAQWEDLVAAFVGPLGGNAVIPAFNRQHVRTGSEDDEYALTAWRIRVVNLALRESLPHYTRGTVSAAFLGELARLSYLDSGPLLAKEFLNKGGIHLVFERHLPKTYLDGAAMQHPDGSPLIALTLRYDRLDNFWFTLFHELAHVALHIDQEKGALFFDDLSKKGNDKCEKEADAFASEALIPAVRWKSARLNRQSSPQAVKAFAEALRISPAIPAGRIRFESGNFSLFKPQIGMGKLRPMFEVP
jgi:HTH-type transcriptional regulator/antitoxin HigA